MRSVTREVIDDDAREDPVDWIFDSRISMPHDIGGILRLWVRWKVLGIVVLVLGIIAALIAWCCSKDVDDLMWNFGVVRAGLILALCIFMVYVTWRARANRNARKLAEQEEMYKEIAKYYRERRSTRDSDSQG